MADPQDEMIEDLQNQINEVRIQVQNAQAQANAITQSLIDANTLGQDALLMARSNSEAISQNTDRIVQLVVDMPNMVDIQEPGAEWTHMVSLDTQGYFIRDEQGRAILHREDGPAVVKFHPMSDTVIEERHYRDGVPHREDGPSFVIRDVLTGLEISRSYAVRGTNFGGQSCNRTTGRVERQNEVNGGRLRWLSETGANDEHWPEFIPERDIL